MICFVFAKNLIDSWRIDQERARAEVKEKLEAMIEVQARAGDGLGQGSGSSQKMKCIGSRYTLEVDMTEHEGLDVGVRESREPNV